MRRTSSSSGSVRNRWPAHADTTAHTGTITTNPKHAPRSISLLPTTSAATSRVFSRPSSTPCSPMATLHAPRRSHELRRGAPETWRPLSETGRLDADGDSQHRRFRQVFQRPHHRGIRPRHLACGALSHQTLPCSKVTILPCRATMAAGQGRAAAFTSRSDRAFLGRDPRWQPASTSGTARQPAEKHSDRRMCSRRHLGTALLPPIVHRGRIR